MKQVLKKIPEEIEIIATKEAVKELALNKDYIVAYVTARGNGLGILHKIEIGVYGFIYHKDLVTKFMNTCSYNIRFKGINAQEAINNALGCGRNVYIFKSFEEFLEFSVDKATH